MNLIKISVVVCILALNSNTFAIETRAKNHPLISDEDTKLERENFRTQKIIEKKRERLAREEWRKLSRAERKQSVWTNWYRKSLVPALLKLSKLRDDLYRDNLFDSYIERPNSKNIHCSQKEVFNRTINGSCNHLEDKIMGAAWTRFSRNIDLRASHVDQRNLLYPNPRTISKELFTRDEFKPVPFLNLMAVSWIQFQTHDWFSHGENENPETTAPIYLPLEDDDLLGEEMIIPLTRIDHTRNEEDNKKLPYTSLNEVTHWWDASQIYGSDLETANSLRSFKSGLLKVDGNGYIPTTTLGIDRTGFNRNWWVGLSMLHNLFVREHNAIAQELEKNYPKMTDNELYQKARLINAALIAKIHTIEWTPAILPNQILRKAMEGNWKGLINTTNKVEPWFELFDQKIAFGIVGGKRDLADEPFQMTEEFVSVYRMHPLLPDHLKIMDKETKKVTQKITLHEAREANSSVLVKRHGLSDLFYSFGQMNPGQLTLNNYPRDLQNISIPFAGNVDLGTIDIVRDRERGVPRYNEFRRQIKLKPLKSFEQFSPDKELVAKLKKIYNNDIEMVDLLVGSLAEAYRPTGYGFGETAFQIFAIMASRRLHADRFYTENYNKETYTKSGLKWIDDNNMKTILLRHFPELKDSLFGVKNAFNPWNK